MADYRKMYYHLFNETTKAIEILQNAQQKAEEIFTDSEDLFPKLMKKENHSVHKQQAVKIHK